MICRHHPCRRRRPRPVRWPEWRSRWQCPPRSCGRPPSCGFLLGGQLGPVDLDLRDAGQRLDPSLGVALDLGTERATGGGQGDLDRHQPSVGDGGTLGHAEFHDVRPELGIDHTAEHVHDGVGARPIGLSHGFKGRFGRHCRHGLCAPFLPRCTLECTRRYVVITVTESAASKVKELLEQEDDEALALRVAVRPGGCSGFSYEMFFDGELTDDDQATTYGGREGGCRPDERPAPRRRHARLQGRSSADRLLHRQPERPAHLRLRPVVLLIKIF